MKYERENLVVLEYDFNTGDFDLKWLKDVKAEKYLSIQGVEKDSLRVDGNRWDFEVWRGNRIGESRNFYDLYAPGMIFGGIIGVYDITKHKKNIKHALKDARNIRKKCCNCTNINQITFISRQTLNVRGL